MMIHDFDTSGNVWPAPGGCIAGDIRDWILRWLRAGEVPPPIMPR
ncbi:hypothetical protein [Sphingobium cupriresistens]|nr:hypothetical protein [Sphingobium cupriresistens]